MKFYGKAEDAIIKITEQFKSGNIIKPLSQIFFQGTDFPSANYSFNNQIIIAIWGMMSGKNYTGAGGYNYWKSKGRYVKKGSSAIPILAPLTKTVKETDDNGNENKSYRTYGFTTVNVFAYEQTDGEPIVKENDDREDFLKNLPFANVASSWGITVEVDDNTRALGYYSPFMKKIALKTRNLSTWCHELIHCADDKLGMLDSDKNKREIVAELGGAVLLTLIGSDEQADLGGCYEYCKSYSNKDKLFSDIMNVNDRVCKCVNYIIEEATKLTEEELPVAA